MPVKIRNQLAHLVDREPLIVYSKYPSSTHIINIGPHSLEWDSSTTVVVNYLGDIEDILVAISAVVILEEC